MLYQRADVGASGPKFIEGETAVVSEFISSSVEDHVAVERVLYAAEKSRLSKLRHQAENRRLTLCKVLDISLLDAARLRTFSNKSAFDNVSSLTLDLIFKLAKLRFYWQIRQAAGARPSQYVAYSTRSVVLALCRCDLLCWLKSPSMA